MFFGGRYRTGLPLRGQSSAQPVIFREGGKREGRQERSASDSGALGEFGTLNDSILRRRSMECLSSVLRWRPLGSLPVDSVFLALVSANLWCPLLLPARAGMRSFLTFTATETILQKEKEKRRREGRIWMEGRRAFKSSERFAFYPQTIHHLLPRSFDWSGTALLFEGF